MQILRLEGKSGEGLYNSEEMRAVQNVLYDIEDEESRFFNPQRAPHPGRDDKLAKSWFGLTNSTQFLFGFQSISQMVRYFDFDLNLFDQFANVGVNLVAIAPPRVLHSEVILGDHQLVFHRSLRDRGVSITPISAFMSKIIAEAITQPIISPETLPRHDF